MMDKEKVKETLGEAAAKAKVALSEIKANFKADEGTTGFRKIQSMFVNLWKSGTTGRVALIASSVIVLLLLVSLFGGGGEPGTSFASKSKRKVPKDMLAVKGLYMRMPGDDAVEACKELVASSKDLVVVDFRNGIEREKDEATKSKEKKVYEEAMKKAETDVEKFLKWSYTENGKGYDPKEKEFLAKENTPEYVGELSLPGGDRLGRFASAAAFSLADKYGYQMECMIPGKKYTSEPQTVGSFVVHASRYDSLEKQILGEEWRGTGNYPKIAQPVLATKGLEPLPEVLVKRGKVWFRLTLNDAEGKPVTKTKLTKAFLRFARLRNQGKLNSPQIKEIAEKYVDSFLQWVEFDAHCAFFMNRSEPNRHGELVSSIIGAKIDNMSDEAVMMSLAKECHLKVEWGLPARSIKSEEVIDTVTIPATYAIFRGGHEHLQRLLVSKGFGFSDVHSAWIRLVLKTTNGVEVSKAEVVKNYLAECRFYPPSDKLTIAKKNLIEIAFKDKGAREDELKGLCFVWVDDQNKVKEIRFNEVGMARLFNAGDLSGEEFAQALVNNYSIIPSLKPNVEEESMLAENGESIHVKTSTWIHKDPKGYQVKIFERTAYYKNGIMKYDAKNADSTSPLTYALALAGKTPMKYFTIFAIKPESSRKFD